LGVRPGSRNSELPKGWGGGGGGVCNIYGSVGKKREKKQGGHRSVLFRERTGIKKWTFLYNNGKDHELDLQPNLKRWVKCGEAGQELSHMD